MVNKVEHVTLAETISLLSEGIGVFDNELAKVSK